MLGKRALCCWVAAVAIVTGVFTRPCMAARARRETHTVAAAERRLSSVIVDYQPPVECGDFRECFVCSKRHGCGWCERDQTCYTGNATSPSGGIQCPVSAWHFTSQQCDACSQQDSCKRCTHLHACGWCGSSNRCYSGGEAPPAYAECSTEDWAWVSCEDDLDDEWRVSGPLFIGVVIVLPVLLCIAVWGALACTKRRRPDDEVWMTPDLPRRSRGLSSLGAMLEREPSVHSPLLARRPADTGGIRMS